MRYSTMIAAFNDARRIGEAIESVADCDDIVVVIDDRTTDDTAAVAEAAGCRVMRRTFDGFANQKNFGIDQCLHDWVLVLDTDERLTPELRESIARAEVAAGTVAYEFAWRNYLGTSWLAHGGLYPDRHTRLFDRRHARYGGRQIHEVLEVDGRTGRLTGDVLHYTYSSPGQYLAKVRRYAPQEAAATAKRPPLKSVPGEFVNRYVRLQGWKDGWPGLVSALLLAYYRFIIWIRAGRA